MSIIIRFVAKFNINTLVFDNDDAKNHTKSQFTKYQFVIPKNDKNTNILKWSYNDIYDYIMDIVFNNYLAIKNDFDVNVFDYTIDRSNHTKNCIYLKKINISIDGINFKKISKYDYNDTNIFVFDNNLNAIK